MSGIVSAPLVLMAGLVLGIDGVAPQTPPGAPVAPLSVLATGGHAEMAPAGRGGARGGNRPASRPPARAGGGGARTQAAAHNAGGRPAVRSNAATNINHGGNANVNRNVNRNSNVNVNVHNDYHGGGYYHNDWDDWDDHYHPVATAAAITATAAVVGSIVRSIPPSCSTVVVNGVSYSQCGSTWYQPQYAGSSVQYVVVAPPR